MVDAMRKSPAEICRADGRPRSAPQTVRAGGGQMMLEDVDFPAMQILAGIRTG